jgi:AAA ATPase domain
VSGSAGFPVRGGTARLAGRRAECAALDRLVEAVSVGESRALVVHGEPGAGKTVLLEYLAGRAADGQVVRVAGVQSEMELAFAGLHQVCAPLLDRLEVLPGPQAEAVRTAFGLSAGPVPDRFLVGLAVLSLLAEAAAKQPLVCLVDDAQWLDRASAQVLAFVARRLEAESVGLVFGTRTPGGDLGGLPELVVGGLSEGEAQALLNSVLAGPIDARVREQIIADTGGNPLAILELPRGLTAAELAGGFGLPGAGPLAGSIEDSFRRRVEALPLDLDLARETYLDAYQAARFAGHLAGAGDLLEVSRAILALPPPAHPPRPDDLLLDGLALLVTDGPAAAAPVLRHARSAFASTDVPAAEAFWWGWLVPAAGYALWDDHGWDLTVRQVQLAREAGALDQLPLLLSRMAMDAVWSGDLRASASLIAEADTICAATGSRHVSYATAMLAAFRGREAEAAPLIQATLERAAAGGREPRCRGRTGWPLSSVTAWAAMRRPWRRPGKPASTSTRSPRRGRCPS